MINIIDSPDRNIHFYVLYSLMIFKHLPTDMYLSIYQLFFKYFFSSINVVVYTVFSHYTLQAKLALCTLFYTEEFYFLFYENDWV